jgi:protocatechuate 3,4-dioxygenase beta subunit
MNPRRLTSAAVAFLFLCTLVHAFEPHKKRATVDTLFAKACTQTREGKISRAIKTLKEAAKLGDLCMTRCLTESALIDLHEKRPFRELMRSLAKQSEIGLTPPDEPGDPLLVTGRVVDDDLKPIEGALLYVFHTNSKGSYSSTGGNATMGDSLNPRLFGYIRTDKDGRYSFRTIRPGPYPGDGPPAHIHYEVEAKGYEKLVTELMFQGDPRVTTENQPFFVRAGFSIVKVEKDADGIQRCSSDLMLEPTT